MKDNLSLWLKSKLYRFACVCKRRADYHCRRDQMARTKIYLKLWGNALDARDLLR